MILKFFQNFKLLNKLYVWTVSVILIDPPCKDGNARFTKIPLKPLSDQ